VPIFLFDSLDLDLVQSEIVRRSIDSFSLSWPNLTGENPSDPSGSIRYD